MANYTTQQGDTLDLISRRFYGTGSGVFVIRQANPGLVEPIRPGTLLIIPSKPTDAGSIQSSNPDDVAVFIDGKRYRFWNQITISTNIDTVAAVTFSTPFEADREAFREAFRPFSFKPVTIAIGSEVLFTGTLLNVSPDITPESRSASVTCYARPGVLQEVTAPASMWPIEFNGHNLRSIASYLCQPFGIDVHFSDSPWSGFDRVALDAGGFIWSFLSDLASQRGFVMTSDAVGDLVFWKPVAIGNPVAKLEQGQPGLIGVSPQFNPQSYYSHITAIESASAATEGSQYTARNTKLPGALRPYAFKADDVETGDLQAAAKSKLGRMIGNAVTYTASIASWRDPSGALWRPNTTLTALYPDAMIYRETELLIKSVEFNRTGDNKTATLGMTLPGAYSGDLPAVLPWE